MVNNDNDRGVHNIIIVLVVNSIAEMRPPMLHWYLNIGDRMLDRVHPGHRHQIIILYYAHLPIVHTCVGLQICRLGVVLVRLSRSCFNYIFEFVVSMRKLL